MIPYIVFFLIIFILLCYIKNEKVNIATIIFLTAIICFSGLRYGIGQDYGLYNRIFIKTNILSRSFFRTGIGYYYMSRFFLLVSKNYNLFIFIISFITNVCIYYFCKKMSSKISVSLFSYIFLGYYVAGFNTFRYFLSVAFFLLSYVYLDSNKYFRFVLFSVFSVSIHYVAILGIFFTLFFNKIYKRFVNKKVIIVFGILLLIFYSVIYKFIVQHISSISIYSDDSVYKAGFGTYFRLLFYGIILLILYGNRHKLIELNKKNIEYINIYAVSYLIMIVGIYNILFVRLSTFLNIFIILLIPEIWKIYNLDKIKLDRYIFYVGAFVYYLMYVHSFGGIVPYTSILSIL